MKTYQIVLAAIAVTSVTAKSHLVSQDQMDDLFFMDKMFYDMYNGFVRGLYREHTTKVVDEQCFGPWIQSNVTHLNSIMEKMLLDFQLPGYNDASQAAQEVVNLIYANYDYCQVQKIVDDFKAFCPDGYSCLSDLTLTENLKKNGMQLGMKIYELFNLLLTSEMITDEEILQIMDKLGETYGYIFSYLFDFNIRFNGNDHAHKKLSVPQVSLPRPAKFLKRLF